MKGEHFQEEALHATLSTSRDYEETVFQAVGREG
jgi:hypothetical protein